MFIDLFENKGTFAVKADFLDVPDFIEEVSDIFKSYGFTFHSTHKKFPGLVNIWLSTKRQYLPKLMLDLHAYYREDIPESILTVLKNIPETKRMRSSIDKELMLSEPKGEYQVEGIRAGIQRNRLMLAWEMGLGKSFTIITILNHAIKNKGVDRTLILCPPESIINFRNEMKMFGYPEYTNDDFYIVTPENRDPFNSDKKVVICTYRRFLMVCEDEYKRVKKTKVTPNRMMKPIYDLSKWGTERFLILDESHMVKNAKAKQTIITRLHSQYFEYRYLLTGTPAPNGVEDYYSQLDIMDPTIVGKPYQGFLGDIAVLGDAYSEYAIAEYKPEEIKKFETEVSPWVSRKLAKGNLELPPLYEKPILCEMNPKQKALYEDIVMYMFSTIKEADGIITTKSVQNKFPFVLQALDNPDMLKGKISRELSNSLFNKVEKWKFKDNIKIEILASLLDRHVSHGEKVIVWGGHPSTLDSLEEMYGKKYGFKALHGTNDITGFKDKEDYRAYYLEKFRKDPKCQVIGLSYLALGTAINLVESTVSIYIDRPTDLAPYLQSSKRNHRIKQTKRVIKYDIIIERSIDHTNYKSLMNEKGLRNDTLFNKQISIPMAEWKRIFLGDQL